MNQEIDFVKNLPYKEPFSYKKSYFQEYYKSNKIKTVGRKTLEERKQIIENSKLKKKSGTYILKFD